jgi:hypothetical protein
MLEVGLAIGPRREQHDARRGAAGHHTCRAFDRIEQPPVTGGDVLHAQLAKRIGELPRHDDAVVQHIAQAGRHLATPRQHLPAAVVHACQIEADDVRCTLAGATPSIGRR